MPPLPEAGRLGAVSGRSRKWKSQVLPHSVILRSTSRMLHSLQILTSNLSHFITACSLCHFCPLDRKCSQLLEITGFSDGHSSALWTSDRWSRDEEKRSGDEGGLAKKQTPAENAGSDRSPAACETLFLLSGLHLLFQILAFLCPRATQAFCLLESDENR